MTSAPPTQPPRDRALDGLRGLAALAVVLAHLIVATVPELTSRFFDPSPRPVTGLAWLASETPLAFVWAGREWVIVFFMLSGLVLSLAAAEGARFDAARYYPTRLVRLYLPVWACLPFAALMHELVAHERVAGATQWMNLHAVGWSPEATAKELLLVLGAGDPYYTTVLWTLRWEVLYSLALPLFLIVARRFPLRLLVGGSLLVVLVGGVEFELLRFIAAFMIGTTMAFGREQIRRTLARGDVYAATFVASPLLLTATYWMPAGRWHGVALLMVMIGAAGMIAIAMTPGPFARWMRSRPMQLVGRRSFSLYLVHEPIVVTTAFALGGRPSLPLLVACAALPIAAATALFYRWVERPAHTLARRLGRSTAQRVHRAPGTTPATKAQA